MSFAKGGDVLRRYGIWIFTLRRPLSDIRIWAEDVDGYPRLTPFQRGIGIRACGVDDSYTLDFHGIFGDLSKTSSRQSLNDLIRGCFGSDYRSLQRGGIAQGHRAVLANARGFALVW
ncbi:hypothetical protein [Lysobacter sp. CA199]|uniref:hypothetical protein n=1 Tax=Lysobacter sp. CA199 TaxID=3455608 RepID=UPI003F8CF9DD